MELGPIDRAVVGSGEFGGVRRFLDENERARLARACADPGVAECGNRHSEVELACL